jgi:hypothetical protein
MQNNKRTFLVHVVEEYKAYRVGSRIVEAHTAQEAKALAKDFKENGDHEDYCMKDEGAFDEAYENMGASPSCHTIKSKMSITELVDGSPIESPKFRPTAHYVDASTGELL